MKPVFPDISSIFVHLRQVHLIEITLRILVINVDKLITNLWQVILTLRAQLIKYYFNV